MKESFLSRVISFATVMSLAVVGLTGCGSETENSSSSESDNSASNIEFDSGEKENVTVRVADMAAWNNAYFEYGAEKGVLDDFFENDKYNIEFDINSFASGPAENEAFAAGQLDFAPMGSMPATTGSSSDFGYKIVAILGKTENIGSLVAVADSGITSIADLKGKKVGTIFGGTLHYYTGKYLETAGLTYDDVEFINSGNETPTSLRAEEIDAGTIGNDVALDLVNEGTCVLLADSIDGIIGFSEVCIADEIINNYDGLAAILLKGFDDLFQYVDANVEDYLDYLGDLTGVNTSSILATWDYSVHKVESFSDPEIYSNAEDLLIWMQDQDMIENKNVKFEELLDLSVAEEAGIQ